MYILASMPHETIWGGNKMMKYADEKTSNVGHLYSLYCREGVANLVLNGCSAGINFNNVFNEIKENYNLEQYEFFPLTIAFVDAAENLSIQVHPNDQIAAKLEGTRSGKQESWYFLSTPHHGFIYNGCKCKLKKDVMRNITANRTEKVVDCLDVKEGCYVYVKPGTLHALTSGSFVYEIEYGSDFTYRFFDYNRKGEDGRNRELHLEKAILALDTKLKSSPHKFNTNMEIYEENYVTTYKKNINYYKNCSVGLECVTYIKGQSILDNTIVDSGMTVILEPNEVLEDLGNVDVIIARLI